MKPRLFLTLAALCVIVPLAACRTPDERARDERVEGQKEINNAASKVRKAESDAAKKILDAKDPKDRMEEKINATKNIAEADEKLSEEKAEAAREVAQADATAAASHGMVATPTPY